MKHKHFSSVFLTCMAAVFLFKGTSDAHLISGFLCLVGACICREIELIREKLTSSEQRVEE